MKSIKKLLGRLFSKRKKPVEEKKSESWYNDQYEKGEVARGDLPYGTGGSETTFMSIANDGH